VLGLPTGQDDAIIARGLGLVKGIGPAQSAACLVEARAICQEPGADYQSALDATVALVANGPWL
jgi:hypothetical protein